MDTEYIRDGLEFALQILDELDEETCRNYYFEEYKFDKEPPADEIENVICLALKSKLGINESLNEDKPICVLLTNLIDLPQAGQK